MHTRPDSRRDIPRFVLVADGKECAVHPPDILVSEAAAIYIRDHG